MSTVTCRHDGCGNNGIPIDLEHPVDPDSGMPVDPWTVICCGDMADGTTCYTQISDISEQEAAS
jgi:hypothetical protein